MKNGHRSECKACHKSRQRQWYQANRAHAIAEVKPSGGSERDANRSERNHAGCERNAKLKCDSADFQRAAAAGEHER